MGELADDELENVSGGMYAGDGRMTVTVGFRCGDYGWSYWRCKAHNCGMGASEEGSIPYCYNGGHPANCGNCEFCVYERALWLCNPPMTNKNRW